jgi:two-component system, chemotaxis family, response regulator Rcp1
MRLDQAQEKFVDILLVEDNPADVNMLQEILQDSRISNSLHVVKNGEEAMDFLHRRGEFAASPRPDLILLDIGLPKKGGLEVLGEIKGDPDLKRIPVIMLTASKKEEHLVEAYELHANSYLVKPMHLDQIYQMIKSIEDFWFSCVKQSAR